MRVRPIAVLVLCGVAALNAQTARLTFEVASVKPQRSPLPPFPDATTAMAAAPRARSGGVYAGTHTTVETLILFAYNLQRFEVISGPDWIRRDYFDLNAKAASDVSTDDLRLMVQSLLGDRFKLVVHTERREIDAFALVPARADGQPGPYLQRVDDDCKARSKLPPRPVVPTAGTLIGNCVDMRRVARMVAFELKSPVIDKTGFDGLWVLEAQFARARGVDPARASASDPAVPPLAIALEEQLGLRLAPIRGPVEVLVIDSVQQPTEN